MIKKSYLYLAFMAGAWSACEKARTVDLSAPAEPAIVSIQPDRGDETTVVSISGRRFSPLPAENTVEFNGVKATVLSAADNLLKVQVPENVSTGPLTVTVNGYTGKGPVFTYVPHEKTYSVVTVAGSVAGFRDGQGTAAQFKNCDGVAMDLQGNIIITDRTNHSIRKMTPGGLVTTIAGNGSAGYAEGVPGQFNYPWHATVDATGNIYVADKDAARIRKITPGGVVSTFAGNGTPGFAEGAPGQFRNPVDVKFDRQGNLYVADQSNHRIRKITPAGAVSTFAGDGTTNIFNTPTCLAIDAAGNVFVSDRLHYCIKRVTPGGQITTISGTGTKGYADGALGKPLTAMWGDVYGIALDNEGNLLVADASNARIRKITPAAGNDWSAAVVSTIAGSGQVGKADGPGPEASFNNPYDLTVDAQGNIYVSDASSHLIRKITYK